MSKVTDVVHTIMGSEDSFSGVAGSWNDAIEMARGSKEKSNDDSMVESKNKPNGASTEKTGSDKKPEKDKPMGESERKDKAKDYAKEILENFDDLKGDGKYITLEDLQNYKNAHPDMKQELKDAISFWSQEEAFDILETAKNPDKLKPDGDLSENDLKGFIEKPEALPEKLYKKLDEKSDISPEGDKYKDYIKENPNADKEAKQIAKYVDIIDQNYDDIKDAKDDGKYLSRADLIEYAEQNQGIGKEFKDALEFWSERPAFRMLETAKDSENLVPDGDLSKNDIKGWFEHEAPTSKDDVKKLKARIKEGGELEAESKEYRDFVKNNPDADEASLKMFKYADILNQNYEGIVSAELAEAESSGKTGTNLPYLTIDKLKGFKEEHPNISKEFKEAIDFWTQPGAFNILESAKDPTRLGFDGDLSKNDLKGWMEKQAPKNAGEAVVFLSRVADANLLAKTDTSKLDKDVFENPDKHSAKDKAAALQDLYAAQKLIAAGAEAGMYRDAKSQHAISREAGGVHPNPEKVYEDVNRHIAILEADEETVKYLEENGNASLQKVLDDNEGLKNSLKKSYEEDIKTGKALDSLWDAKDGDKDQQSVLAEFYTQARTFQSAFGVNDAGEIQKAVQNSSHNDELESFYEKSLASGDRLDELLKDNSFAEAVSAYSMDIALYNSALNPEFTGKFDDKLSGNISEAANEHIFKDSGFDDLKESFGTGKGDKLDEKKVEKIIESVKEESPELFVNDNGTTATTDQIMAGFRGVWDVARQGGKALTELAVFDKNGDFGKANSSGVLHGVSGLLLAGATIAKGAQSGGKLNDRAIVDITTGSIQTATTLTEGGIKGYQTHLKEAKERSAAKGKGRAGEAVIENVDPDSKNFKDKFKANLKNFENAAKGLGGAAGAAAGAYAIFDGVKAIRAGDKLTGGMGVTAGSLGAMAGLAGMVEGGLGLAGVTASRFIPMMAGGFGAAAAGMAALAMFVPALVDEVKQEGKVDDYGKLLGGYLEKYEIDGVPYGNLLDVPEEELPDDGDSWWST